MYCEKQRKMRGEVAQFNKIAVSISNWVSLFLRYSNSKDNSEYTHCVQYVRFRSVAHLAVSRCVAFYDDHFNWKVHLITYKCNDILYTITCKMLCCISL